MSLLSDAAPVSAPLALAKHHYNQVVYFCLDFFYSFLGFLRFWLVLSFVCDEEEFRGCDFVLLECLGSVFFEFWRFCAIILFIMWN